MDIYIGYITMVYQSGNITHIYKHEWNVMLNVYFIKCKEFKGPWIKEIYDFEQKTEDNITTITKKIKINIDLPGASYIVGTDELIFSQEVNIDIKNKILNIKSRNETYTNSLMYDECNYVEIDNLDGSKNTKFERSAILDIPWFPGSTVIEKYAIKKYMDCVSQIQDINESIINKYFKN